MSSNKGKGKAPEESSEKKGSKWKEIQRNKRWGGSSSTEDDDKQKFIHLELNLDEMNAFLFGRQLDAWSSRLGNRTIDGDLVLPKQEGSPDIIRLQLINDIYRAAVFYRADNLYGIGVESENESRHEIAYDNEWKFIRNSEKWYIGHNYACIMEAANASRLDNHPLDLDHLKQAVCILSKLDNKSRSWPWAFLTCILSFSEPLRLSPLKNRLIATFDVGFYLMERPVELGALDWVLRLVRNWKRTCRILKQYRDRDNRGTPECLEGSPECLHEIADMGLIVNGDLITTYEQLAELVGLHIYIED